MTNSLVRVLNFAVLLTLSGAAMLQAAEQGKFHLPVAAHWGGALLQPGDYTVSLPDAALGRHEMRIQSAAKTVYVMPLVADVMKTSHSSYLALTIVDGQYFIRTFLSGAVGKEFLFPVPKATRREEARQPSAGGGDSMSVSVN